VSRKSPERIDRLLDAPEARRAGLPMRVRAYVGLSRHEEALADIAELRQDEEAQDWLDLCEAWCRKRTADLPGAIRCMEQLIDRKPKSDIGHFNLGCYLALAGKKDRAIDEISIACGLTEQMRALAQDEPDLDSLRSDARFRALIKATPPGPG